MRSAFTCSSIENAETTLLFKPMALATALVTHKVSNDSYSLNTYISLAYSVLCETPEYMNILLSPPLSNLYFLLTVPIRCNLCSLSPSSLASSLLPALSSPNSSHSCLNTLLMPHSPLYFVLFSELSRSSSLGRLA